MIEPLKHKVLIQRDPTKTETEGGFFIPDIAQKKETTGTILALGPLADDVLKAGQKVVFGLNDGYAVDPKYCDDKNNCVLIADNQIRCVLDDA